MQLKFDGDSLDVVDNDVVEDEEENENKEECPGEVDISAAIKYDFIMKGSFVTLPSHVQAIEQFYLVEVVAKGVAEENLIDKHGHSVTSGEMYIQGAYFEMASENKKCVMYNRSNPKAVHIVFLFVN